MSTLKEKLLTYARNGLNVMLIGRHGVGKTTIVKEISESIGYKFKYFSTPTLDPYSEFVGVPVPNSATKDLEFYRTKDLKEAEFLFFDELNRVQNDRILNAVLEIVQFRSINGEKLNNLKVVWCAINPPGDYQVVELDPALEDRFHVYVKMEANINMEYMKTKMDEKVARAIKEWWDNDLSDEQRKVFTPRRCEYVGFMIQNGIPWRDAQPIGSSIMVPLNGLEKRVAVALSGLDEFVISKENIMKDIPAVVARLKKDPRMAIGLSSALSSGFKEEEVFQCRDIIELLPSELIEKVLNKKWSSRQQFLIEIFKRNGVDIKNMYPRMAKCFKEGLLK